MTSRNDYLDGDALAAQQAGCDIVQLKYDGHWCKAVGLTDRTEYYSETGRLFSTSGPFIPDSVVVGEFMRGTQWSTHPSRQGLFYIFDIWAYLGVPMTDEPYSTRYKLLRKLELPSVYRVVDCYRMQDFPQLWSTQVEYGEFEGVVFRKSTDLIDAKLYRHKKTYSLDGVVYGFEEGEGKHTGRLGALLVLLPTGVTTTVGNGFSDAQREEIWAHRENYVNKPVEFVANAVFASGSVRHARFVRWREDKL